MSQVRIIPVQVQAGDILNPEAVPDPQPDSILNHFAGKSSVADPVSGAFLTPGSGMGKKSGSGSGMTNQDHIS